jgi:predicted  nucleic acid-binding Zn-ribbon protein
MERQLFDKSEIERISAELANAPHAARKLSKADAIRALRPQLDELREKRGYTLEKLVELLGEKGLEVKVATLQSALKRSKKKPKARELSTVEKVAAIEAAGLAVKKETPPPPPKAKTTPIPGRT